MNERRTLKEDLIQFNHHLDAIKIEMLKHLVLAFSWIRKVLDLEIEYLESKIEKYGQRK